METVGGPSEHVAAQLLRAELLLQGWNHRLMEAAGRGVAADAASSALENLAFLEGRVYPDSLGFEPRTKHGSRAKLCTLDDLREVFRFRSSLAGSNDCFAEQWSIAQDDISAYYEAVASFPGGVDDVLRSVAHPNAVGSATASRTLNQLENAWAAFGAMCNCPEQIREELVERALRRPLAGEPATSRAMENQRRPNELTEPEGRRAGDIRGRPLQNAIGPELARARLCGASARFEGDHYRDAMRWQSKAIDPSLLIIGKMGFGSAGERENRFQLARGQLVEAVIRRELIRRHLLPDFEAVDAVISREVARLQIEEPDDRFARVSPKGFEDRAQPASLRASPNLEREDLNVGEELEARILIGERLDDSRFIEGSGAWLLLGDRGTTENKASIIDAARVILWHASDLQEASARSDQIPMFDGRFKRAFRLVRKGSPTANQRDCPAACQVFLIAVNAAAAHLEARGEACPALIGEMQLLARVAFLQSARVSLSGGDMGKDRVNRITEIAEDAFSEVGRDVIARGRLEAMHPKVLRPFFRLARDYLTKVVPRLSEKAVVTDGLKDAVDSFATGLIRGSVEYDITKISQVVDHWHQAQKLGRENDSANVQSALVRADEVLTGTAEFWHLLSYEGQVIREELADAVRDMLRQLSDETDSPLIGMPKTWSLRTKREIRAKLDGLARHVDFDLPQIGRSVDRTGL